MRIIGLTGGIASGKSTVSNILRRLGGKIIDADALNHELMRKGGASYDEITAEFGVEILAPDGEIDRKALGAVVFADKARLKVLEEICHRHVTERTYELIAEAESEKRDKFIVIDAPLLIEANMHKICDEVWLMYCEHEERIRRLCARDGMNRAEAEKRIATQTPFEVLRPHSALILDNNGSEQDLERQVRAGISDLLTSQR